MRRLIAILVLLGSGWSQSSALDCPMRAPSDSTHAAAAPVEDGASRHHQAGDADADGDSSTPRGSHPPDSDCRLLVSCSGGVLIASMASLSSDPRPSSTAAVASENGSRATVFPNQEPPPPRLPV